MNKTKIVISSNSGFCFGVKRALDIAKGALKNRKTVYSLGPIIHNPQVVDEFSRKGLKIVRDIRKIKPGNATVVLPSHGVNPELLKGKKFTYIDTTCPLVERVQKIIRGLKEKGYFIIIVGDRKHPEVRALRGIAGKNSCVVKDKKEAKALPLPARAKKAALISQTTASLSNFKEVLSQVVKKDFAELTSFNTVCKNTIDRQREACGMARRVGAMIIIGGKQSANTSKLARSCRAANKNTYHIESGKDLKTHFFKNKKSIGIATGASTPPYVINEVVERIRRFEI